MSGSGGAECRQKGLHCSAQAARSDEIPTLIYIIVPASRVEVCEKSPSGGRDKVRGLETADCAALVVRATRVCARALALSSGHTSLLARFRPLKRAGSGGRWKWASGFARARARAKQSERALASGEFHALPARPSRQRSRKCEPDIEAPPTGGRRLCSSGERPDAARLSFGAQLSVKGSASRHLSVDGGQRQTR